MSFSVDIVDSDADAFLESLEGLAPQDVHTLDVLTAVDYATYLHDRLGYFVISEEHLVETVDRVLAEVEAQGGKMDDRTVRQALDAAGLQEVDWLRSKTDQMRPPAKAGGPMRPAHPGGWADVKGLLANSLEHAVDAHLNGGGS